MPWQPSVVYRSDRALRTAAETLRVMTDLGAGYLKVLGNRGGPHRLAADWVGTQLAEWLGLRVFEYAIVNILHENDILLHSGAKAQPGPAFITKEEPGDTWSGEAKILSSLVNPQDIGLLVLFDTWVRNPDRFPPNPDIRKPNRNNVFLSRKDLADGEWRLMAMDHTHCFNGPGYLDRTLDKIDFIKDEGLYGLFPEFAMHIRPHWNAMLDGIQKLKALNRQWVEEITLRIPPEWQVDSAGRTALANLVYNRAVFVSDTFNQTLAARLLQ